MNGMVISTALTVFLVLGCGQHHSPPPQYGSAWPQFRHRVDQSRNRVWFLTRTDVRLYDFGTPEKIRRFELPDWINLDEDYSCMPDLIVGPDGAAVISSNVVPWLWRIDADTLEISRHELTLDADSGRELGFSGLAYSARWRAFIAVSHLHGSLWRIDPSLATAAKIQLSAPVPQACGLAVLPRAIEPKAARVARLCVDIGEDGWAIELAPDLRPGHVRGRPCA